MNTNLKTFSVIFLSLTFIFLRFYRLGAQSYWLDEVYTMQTIGTNTIQSVFQQLATDVHPPLYFLLLKFYTGFLGNSETMTRSLSAIFSSTSIFVLYYLTKNLFDKKTAYLASIFCGVSLFQIYYGQEIRPYALVSLLSIGLNLIFFNLLKNPRTANILLYAIFCTLLIYSNYIAGLILLVHWAFLIYCFFIDPKQGLKFFSPFLLANLITFLLLAPWVYYFLDGLKQVSSGFWIIKPNLSAIINLPLSFLSFKITNFNYLLVLTTTSLYVLGYFLPIIFNSNLVKIRKGNSFQKISFKTLDKNIIFIICWLILPIMICFIVSHLFVSVFIDRVLIFTSPALFILIAYLINSFKSKIFQCLLVILILVNSLLNYSWYYTKHHKENWKQAVNFVRGDLLTGDQIVFNGEYATTPFKFYLPSNQNNFLDFKSTPTSSRFWLVIGPGGENNMRTIKSKYSLLGYQRDKMETLAGVRVVLFIKGRS